MTNANIRSVKPGDKSILVVCQQETPVRAATTSYNISCARLSNGAILDNSASLGTNSFKFTGLVNGEEYDIRACVDDGSGPGLSMTWPDSITPKAPTDWKRVRKVVGITAAIVAVTVAVVWGLAILIQWAYKPKEAAKAAAAQLQSNITNNASTVSPELAVMKAELAAIKASLTNTPPAAPAIVDTNAPASSNSELAQLRKMLQEVKDFHAARTGETAAKPGVGGNVATANGNVVYLNGPNGVTQEANRQPHAEPTSVNLWPGQIYNQKINPGRLVFVEKHPGIIQMTPMNDKGELILDREFSLAYTNTTLAKVVVVYMRYSDLNP